MKLNNRPLNNVLNRYNKYLIDLVNKSNIDLSNKQLVTEALLYLKVVTSSDDDDKIESKKDLEKFQDCNYINIDAKPIGDFAIFYAERGCFFFKFNDKETALNYPIIRAAIKIEGFAFNSGFKSFVKKQSNIHFDTDRFLLKIDQLVKQGIK